jgi:hypothetical protein
MKSNLTQINPIECNLSQNHLLSNTIDSKSKTSFNSSLLPHQLSELKNISNTKTYKFPDLRNENQLTFSGLMSELISEFEVKGDTIKRLKKEIFESRKKLDLEKLEMKAYQELIKKSRKEISMIQGKISDVVLNKEKEDSLAKLVNIISTKEARENILTR